MRYPTISYLISFATSLVLLFSSCETVPHYEAQKSAFYAENAISGPHPLATAIGEDVLRKGGNAIDAAVAMQFAMAVCYPRAGNLGGGGFLVYRANDGKIDALDYREKAPGGADRNMYLDESGEVIPGLSRKGHLAVGVPGTVAGIRAMYDRYGTMDWKELVAPAIQMAEQGYRLSATEVARLALYQDDFKELNESCPFMRDNFVEGDIVKQPDLANTLRRIQVSGDSGFYRGETARLIAAEMSANGGLITEADLANYQPAWRKPITSNYDGYRLISMPPSSSGGITMSQALKMMQPFALDSMGFQSLAAAQVMVEAERRAYEDRAEYLGDPDFYPIPIDSLLEDEYLAERMFDFTFDSATASQATFRGPAMTKESFETTHISIVDKDGNAVSITTTLNGNFGSRVMVDGAGFFLNNEMDDFSAKPGVPNMFGLVGAEANAIQPGKRMLSSMTPTIVEKNGQLFMVLGAPGGSTIITAVLQTFINVVEFEMPLDSAIRAPRFHHQWLPDQIKVEPGALADIREELTNLGYAFRDVKSMAKIKAIMVMPDGQLHAATDPRNADDDVAGY